jgi:hypothetical protein
MPKRRRTRQQDRAYRINAELNRNRDARRLRRNTQRCKPTNLTPPSNHRRRATAVLSVDSREYVAVDGAGGVLKLPVQ